MEKSSILERIYLEIGNVCNLSCSFCTGTNRAKRQMSLPEFSAVIQKLKGKVKYLYFHVLGEPLLHPNLDEFIKIAGENGLKVCITTNGTLLKDKGEIVINNAKFVHKVSISLHSLEGNGIDDFEDYLTKVLEFSKSSSNAGIFTVLRLWNNDGEYAYGKNQNNREIETALRREFPEEWQVRPRGFRLQKYLFLEYDKAFVWPTDSKETPAEQGFCYGLIKQASVLADGTVTPCCLDANGEINLGNIFDSELEEILNSKKALNIKQGFTKGLLVEDLCKKCTFIKRLKGLDRS